MKRCLLLTFLTLPFVSITDAQESSDTTNDSEFIEIIQTPPPIEAVAPEPEQVPAPVLSEPASQSVATPPIKVTFEKKPVAEVVPAPPKLEPEAEAKPEPAPKPKKPAGPTRLKFPGVDNVLLDPPIKAHKVSPIPSSMGDTTGDAYIAHRSIVEKYNGWGWVKKESESWKKAKWVAVRENLEQIILPGRHLKHPDSDADMQYRFYGEFSEEKAYEPNKDIFITIFDLKGFEVIGPASTPSGASMPAKATSATRSKPTTGGARSNPFRR